MLEDETPLIITVCALTVKKSETQLHIERFSPSNSSLLTRFSGRMVLNEDLKYRKSNLTIESVQVNKSRVDDSLRYIRHWHVFPQSMLLIVQRCQLSPWCEPKPAFPGILQQSRWESLDSQLFLLEPNVLIWRTTGVLERRGSIGELVKQICQTLLEPGLVQVLSVGLSSAGPWQPPQMQ